MRGLFIIISIILLFTGCYGDDMFERPEVQSVTPEKDSTTALPDTRVTVTFSKQMDTVKTNEEFSLSSSSGTVDGYFSWDPGGRVMTFTPKFHLTGAERYTLRISKGAEDTDGNDLKNDFLSTFHTGGDLGQPVVLSYMPGANTIGNAENSTVTIRFSEPVDMNTIYSGISISPAVQGYFTPNGASDEITFTPLYGFSYGVTYTVNIANSVTDTAGNKLLYPVVFSFTVGDDFVKPELTAYQNLSTPLYLDEYQLIGGGEKDGSITIDFTELVKTDNLSSAISISPAVPFFISTSVAVNGGTSFTRGIIHFTEDLLSCETYTLKISSSVTDMQGNSLDHDYRFVFVTDGTGSTQPDVTSIGDLSGSVITAWHMDEVQPLLIGSGFYDNIGVDFSKEINPTSLKITVDRVTGSGGGANVVNIDWPVTGAGQFRRLKFGLHGLTGGSTFKITIKGGKTGLRDSNNNYMKQDFIQLIRF